PGWMRLKTRRAAARWAEWRRRTGRGRAGVGVGALSARRGKSASALVRLTAARVPGSTPLSSPPAKYWPAAVGANGQSLPNRTWPGRAKASSVGRAAGLEESAVSK
ncbi:hypothetical protein STRIP9103_08014, partial [Streptomyces ipomoeae 91-03]